MQKILEEKELKKIEALKEISTEEAFNILIENKNLFKRTGLNPLYQNNYRHRLKINKPISLETKINLLEKAGFKKSLSWHFENTENTSEKI